MPASGSASVPARARGATPLGAALAAAAVATTLVALWLGFTALTLLPGRDPRHVTLWLGVAAGFVAFAAASIVAVLPGPFAPAASALAALLGVAAAGLGLGTVVRMLSGRPGVHFEAYLLLMGGVLAVHGLLAIAHALAPPGRARP